MAKALYGFVGEPRAALLLRQVAEMRARVAELERALESAEAEVIALRAIAEAKTEVKLDEVAVLA
jgi:hypothetical protein